MPEKSASEFPSRCDETLRLIDYGDSNIPAPDEVLRYTTLSDIAGENVQTPRGRGHLYTFCRHMHREYNILFTVIPNVGLRRIVNGEQVPIARGGIQKASRGLKRAGNILRSTIEKELPKEVRAECWALKQHIGLTVGMLENRRYLQMRKDMQEQKPKTPGEVDQIVRNRILEAFARGDLRQAKKA